MLFDDPAAPIIWTRVSKRSEHPVEAPRLVCALLEFELDRIDRHGIRPLKVATTVDEPTDAVPLAVGIERKAPRGDGRGLPGKCQVDEDLRSHCRVPFFHRSRVRALSQARGPRHPWRDPRDHRQASSGHTPIRAPNRCRCSRSLGHPPRHELLATQCRFSPRRRRESDCGAGELYADALRAFSGSARWQREGRLGWCCAWTCFKRHLNLDKVLFKACHSKSWHATHSCFKRHLESNNVLFKALKPSLDPGLAPIWFRGHAAGYDPAAAPFAERITKDKPCREQFEESTNDSTRAANTPGTSTNTLSARVGGLVLPKYQHDPA